MLLLWWSEDSELETKVAAFARVLMSIGVAWGLFLLLGMLEV